MAAVPRSLLVVLLAAGCGVPAGDIRLMVSLAPGPQSIHEPLGLVVVPDTNTGEFVVRRGDVVLARGPAGAGDVLRFDLDGRTYTLEFGGVQVDTDCEQRGRASDRPQARDIVCRDSTWQPVRLSAADGPLPGTAPTLRGAQPRDFLRTTLPWLLAGAIVGRVAQRSVGVGVLLALATIVGVCVLAGRGFDGTYAITYGLAGLVLAALGLFAAIAWDDNSRAAGLAIGLGTLAGAVPVVFAYPLWAEGGPLVATAAAVPGVIVMMLLLHGLTALLGDAHPASRWLLRSR